MKLAKISRFFGVVVAMYLDKAFVKSNSIILSGVNLFASEFSPTPFTRILRIYVCKVKEGNPYLLNN